MTFSNLLNPQASKILAYKAVSSEQVKALEPIAAKSENCTMYQLMARAGEAAFMVLMRHWPNAQKILVVAGNGNNAGDAYIVATLAHQSGKDVWVICEDPARKLPGDGGIAQANWQQVSSNTCRFDQVQFSQFEVIVDGLLGTGVNGDVKALFQEQILKINRAELPVLSLDLPSGMLANTGIALPVCVEADITITFIAPKPGLLTGIGKQYSGRIEYADLAVGDTFYQLAHVQTQVVNWSALKPMASRPSNSNKGSFGKLLCIGGNQGMPGSIRLTAEAALRSGAGLVKVYCHKSSGAHVVSGRPEIMLQYQDLKAALAWCSCVVIGPGLGQDQWAVQKLDQVIKYLTHHPKPLVLDADALNLLARKKSKKDVKALFAELKACVLTPHPGEAARLLNCEISAIENDRFLGSKQIADSFMSTCILKGNGTLIYSHTQDTEEQCHGVCNGGNPGMATAGMGDLLTGIVGALLAQGMTEQQAATYAVCAHAEAGDRVAREYGQRGMIASDLLQPLRAIINLL